MGLDPSQLADFEHLSPEELQKEADHQTWLAMSSWEIPGQKMEREICGFRMMARATPF